MMEMKGTRYVNGTLDDSANAGAPALELASLEELLSLLEPVLSLFGLLVADDDDDVSTVPL